METDALGRKRQRWVDFQTIIGVPFDMLIAGYGGKTVNVLRLYAARASTDIKNQDNASALSWALRDRRFEIAELLKEAGAKE